MFKRLGFIKKYRGSILFIFGFAAMGSLLVLFVRADTVQIPIEAESASRVGGVLASDSNASGNQYFGFEAYDPETWYGYEKPGPTNTGPTNENILTPISNTQLESMMTDGAVIENVLITGGDVDPNGNNVTIRNFKMNANGNRYGFVMRNGKTNLTLEDGEIYNMSSAAILGMGWTGIRLNIHDSSGDGLKAQSAGSRGPVLVESSWIHRLGKGDGAHADGDQSRSGPDPIVFRGNNCDMPVNEKGGPGAPYKSNACFILHQAEGPIVSFTAEYNWLNGGNYTVYCGGAEDMRYNRIGRGYRYGHRTGTCKSWVGNVWDDTEDPV